MSQRPFELGLLLRGYPFFVQFYQNINKKNLSGQTFISPRALWILDTNNSFRAIKESPLPGSARGSASTTSDLTRPQMSLSLL